MMRAKFHVGPTIGAILVLSVTSLCLAQQATEMSIHSFSGVNHSDGGPSYAGVVFDQAGNLYGTTFHGGAGSCPDKTGKIVGCGTVFELSQIGGIWVESRKYDFLGGDDGQEPMASVVLDEAGSVYGTTLTGGGLGGCTSEHVLVGCGTVFRLTPNAGGGWTKTTLHAFGNTDGAFPEGALTFDKAGHLLGTASAGALYGNGNVFEISHSSSGWSFAPLYDFGATTNDGSSPMAGVILDAIGNLYGTTTYGGNPLCDCGIAYKLLRTSTGLTEVILHRFAGGLKDGANPYDPLLLDATGTVYGTATDGGVQQCLGSGCGVLFSLSRASGVWKETQLHRFAGGPQDGGIPNGLMMDALGDLYGSTFVGGEHYKGSVFKFSPAGGTWTILYSFMGGSNDGAQPASSVTLDGAGNLYGTTTRAGKYGLGTVFELIQ